MNIYLMNRNRLVDTYMYSKWMLFCVLRKILCLMTCSPNTLKICRSCFMTLESDSKCKLGCWNMIHTDHIVVAGFAMFIPSCMQKAIFNFFFPYLMYLVRSFFGGDMLEFPSILWTCSPLTFYIKWYYHIKRDLWMLYFREDLFHNNT